MASEGYQDMTKTTRTDEHKGRQYRCDDCGRTYWTAWGNARRHTCDGEDSEVRTDGGEEPPDFREELNVVLSKGDGTSACHGAFTAWSAAVRASEALPDETHIQSTQLVRNESVSVNGREFIFREYPARHPRERRQVEVVPDTDVKHGYSEPRRWRYVFVLQDHSERVTWDGEGIHAALRGIYAPDPGNTNAGPDGWASMGANGGTRVPEFIRDAVMEHLEIEGFSRPPFIPERDGEYSGMNPEPKAVSSDGGEESTEAYRVEDPHDPEQFGGGGCTPTGHSWEPLSEGEGRKTDPMTVTRMLCLNCEETRPVEDGDLIGYKGAYQYPGDVDGRFTDD